MEIKLLTSRKIFITREELGKRTVGVETYFAFLVERIILDKNPFMVEGDEEERRDFLRLLLDKSTFEGVYSPYQDPSLKLQNHVWYISTESGIETFKERKSHLESEMALCKIMEEIMNNNL